MGHSFTKLFNSILQSTIWVAPDPHRILWITMLAMADRRGAIYASIPGLANTARLQVADVEAGLIAFSGPDKYSRTEENEGRRIEKIDGGWRLLNYDKYRAVRDEETVRESKRKYINARRSKEKNVDSVDQSRPDVDQSRTLYIQAEAEAEADKDFTRSASLNTKPNSKTRRGKDFELPTWINHETWQTYLEMRAKIHKPMTERAKVLVVAELDKLRQAGSDPQAVLDQSTRNAWQDVFPIRPKGNGASTGKAQRPLAEILAADELAAQHAEPSSPNREAGED